MSTENRIALHAEITAQIRLFIAGTILFNQKVAERTGLHLTDMQSINLLELLGAVTPGRLAECTGLTSGGVTVMLDRLEKAGFVRRAPNPQDRRSVLIEVNPRKLKQIHTQYAAINRQLDAFLSEMPETELKTVVKFFSRANAIRAGSSREAP